MWLSQRGIAAANPLPCYRQRNARARCLRRRLSHRLIACGAMRPPQRCSIRWILPCQLAADRRSCGNLDGENGLARASASGTQLHDRPAASWRASCLARSERSAGRPARAACTVLPMAAHIVREGAPRGERLSVRPDSSIFFSSLWQALTRSDELLSQTEMPAAHSRLW